MAGGTAAQGPEQRSGPAAGDDHPWARGTVAPLNIRAQLPPLPLRPALDIRKLSVAQYNGAVSAAMEGLRLLQEPMTAEERKKFEAKWAPLFNFPTTAAVEYFNALTPLLDEVLMLRGVIVQASHAVDEAWLDAKYAAGYESEAGTRAAMAIVAQQTSLLQMAQARLAPAVEKIRALGNPPSPLAAQAAARTQHQEAAKAAEQVLPGITIAPAGLEGAPGTAYTFTPSGRNLPGNVTLGWTFGDGGKASGGMTAARHAFATEGTYTVQVVAYDGGKRPVAKASVPVTIQSKAGSAAAPAAAGEWVLTRIEREDRKATGPTGHPSYDSSEHGDASFGATAHPGIFDFAASWRVPPQRVKPGETVQIPWRFSSGGSGAGSTAGGTLEIGATGETYDPSRLDQQNWHYTGRGAAQSGTYRWKFPAGTPGATMRITVRASAQEINEFASLVRSFVYTFGGAPAASQEAAPAAGAASRAEDEAKRQAIAEHEHNIRAIERFVARDQEELAREADSRRRADLEARIRSAQADIQAEKDLIASLQTGQIVHTRTEWDEHAHGQFVRNIHGQQQVLGAVLKILDRSERLIGILPPHEAARVREFAHRQLSSEVVARMDLTQARKVMDVIGRQVQAYYDGQSARQEEKAAWANYGLEAAQNIKSAADTGMMITSAFGGQSLNLLYQAGTGYVEGGPLEAVKKAATTYSDAIDYAVTAYDGYKKGGLSGAGQDLAFTYVQSKALAWVTGKLGGGQADANRHRPSVQEQFEAARFKQEREWGEALVKDFQRAQAEIQSAGRRGAPPETIMRLQAVARDKAAAVASSLHAKNYLKYKADVHAGKAYDAHMRAIHADVDARVKQQMRDQGWNADEWELKEFRNASSYGKPNMDRDVGLRETPLWEVDANGQPRLDANKRPIPNPERWETRNGKLILKPQVVKNGKAATLHQWQAEAAEAYARAYRQATGRSAAMAMEGVTTSAHPEAYKDLKWLGGDQIPDAGWAGQAADVTRYKLGAPGHADPAASYFTKMQEVARGTSKDMETKLLPLLEKARPKGAGSSSAEADEALRHWRKINAVLSAFGKNEIDPIYAHRRIRELTGGKSLAEVVDQMGTMMEAAVKFGQ
ncbi:MAG: PKD domain-containing protein [Candidatus Methylomirabilales bacterium]